MRSLLCLLVLTCALTAQPAAVEQGGRPGGGPGGGTGGAGGAGQGAPVGQSGGPGGNLPGPLRPAQRLMREGKVDEAMKLYQEYLAANPQSVPALN